VAICFFLVVGRTRSRLSGLALGLIVGGRSGQCDRPALVHRRVMDFAVFTSPQALDVPMVCVNFGDAADRCGVAGLITNLLFVPVPVCAKSGPDAD